MKGADINSHEKGNGLARRYRMSIGIRTEDLSEAGLVDRSSGKRRCGIA